MEFEEGFTFFSYSSEDKLLVEELAERLLTEGVRPWLDNWDLVPGESWQGSLEEAIATSASCCVLIGRGGIGPCQHEEIRAAIEKRVKSGGAFRVIPVLLPKVGSEALLDAPKFLTSTTAVKFTESIDDSDAFRRLVSGIRGVAPGPSQIDRPSCGTPAAKTARPQSLGAVDFSWAGQALDSPAVVHLFIGILTPTPVATVYSVWTNKDRVSEAMSLIEHGQIASGGETGPLERSREFNAQDIGA